MTSSNSIVDWLISLGISNLLTTDNMLSGNTLHIILKKTISEYKNEFLTPASAVNKVNNWNNLIKQLQKINLKVSLDDKNDIIHGNENKVYNILSELKAYLQETKKQTLIDINKIDHRADPKNSKSLLELFILIIIKNLGLNAKESVALLSNDSKYLAHILAKGFKEQPKPVLNLLRDIQDLLPKIQQFCVNKQNEIFFLKSIKPGLISKFKEISQLSLSILQQFTLNCQAPSTPYQILKVHLISTFVLQYRRHPTLLKQISNSILIISKYNKTLITTLIQNFNNKELIYFVYQIMLISEEKGALNQKNFYSMNKLEEVINVVIDGLSDSTLFSTSLLILIKILTTNYDLIVSSPSNDQQKSLMSILNNLEHLAIHKKAHLFTYIPSLFTLLYIFGEKKNVIAPLCFKLCIQKYKLAISIDECQLFAHNFLNLLEEFPSIPNTLIVDAIIQKYQNYNKEVITELDIEILSTIVFGNNLGQNQSQFNQNKSKSKKSNQISSPDEKTSLKIYNFLSKLFFEDVSNAKQITDTIIFIILSNHQSQLIFDLSIKMIKVCLAVHFANIRKLNMSKSIIEGVIKLDHSNVFTKRKNLDIEYFLQQVINMNNKNLNQSIEPLICYSYIQSQSKNKIESEGLKGVLSLLGNASSLIKKYQQDAKMLHEQKRYNKKVKASQIIEKDKQRQEMMNNYASSDSINRKKLNPGENYSLYLSKISKITGDAQKGLEKYQKLHNQKLNKDKLQEIKKQEQQEKKKLLQIKYTNKVLQKGIKIDPRIQNLHQYLWEFNFKQKELLKEKAYDLSSLHLFNPDQEQSNDLQALKYVLKKYNKVLKLYYTLYGGMPKTNSLNLFDELAEKNSLMKVANVWKLFKDHFLDEFMTVKQAQYLIQKINKIKKKSYNDVNLLDFEAFEDFIIQASLTMFSRPPKNLNGHSISYMLEETFYRFRLYASQNKVDSRLFEDENSIQSSDETTLDLNKRLRQNQDYILPEGYKKIIEKKVNFYHQVSLNAFNQTYADVIDVLDEIIHEKMGFHIIQPYSQLVTNVYARSILTKKKQQKNQDFMQKYFSMNVRRQLSNFSNEDRVIAREVAYTISEMVDSIEFGKKYLIGKQIKYNLRQQEEERQKYLEEEQKKRQKRDKQIKKQLQKHKSEQENKKKQEQQQKNKQDKIKQEQKKKKQKYQQELKKKVQQYQKKKQDEKKKQEEEIKKNKLKQQEQFQKKRLELQKAAKIIQDKKQKQKKQKQAEQLAKKQEAIKKSKIAIKKSKELAKSKTKSIDKQNQNNDKTKKQTE